MRETLYNGKKNPKFDSGERIENNKMGKFGKRRKNF